MLSVIRDKVKGVVAWVIVGLIVVPFALFGINQYFTTEQNIAIATVDGEDVSRDSFLANFSSKKAKAQQSLGNNYTNEIELRLKKIAVNEVIEQYLLDKLAQDIDSVVTSDELQKIISTNKEFNDGEVFSLEKYKRLLSLNGLTPDIYEKSIVTSLRRVQIRNNLLDSAFVMDSSLKATQQLVNQQRLFSYISVDANKFLDKVDASEESIKKFYNDNKKSFVEPEKVQVEFVELDPANMISESNISEADLQNLYTEEKQRFSTEEERKAQHILLDDKEVAQKVLKELNDGGNFATLAKQYSIDSSTKDNAGDLGFFAKGAMVPEFEGQVFSMQEGGVSPLVKSDFGYHIIKLNKINPVSTKLFAEVREDLIEIYSQNELRNNVYELSDKLANLAYESSLEEVAETMDLKLQTSTFFSRISDAYDKIFVNLAFSDVVFDKGENSEVIELSGNKLIVMRVKQKLNAKQKDISEVKTEIKNFLNHSLAKKLTSTIADDILKAYASGDDKTADEMLAQNKLQWSKEIWANISSKEADREIVSEVFTLPKPKDSASSYGNKSTNTGTVIVKLLGVKVADVDNSDLIKKSLLEIEAEEAFNSIIQNLKKQAEIKVFTDRL